MRQSCPQWRGRLQDRQRVRRRRRAISPRSVPDHCAMQAVWSVAPRCRRRHCLPKLRGPPYATRLLTATTSPVLLQTLTTWA